MSLPARREGIIPGVANLRLPQFIGEQAARRAIYLDARIAADSPEGRAIVDEVVPSERLDSAVANVINQLTSSGMVSFAANRKALRIGREPLESFREYMAHFAPAQADCHFSAELLANLSRHWLSRKRER
jgi:thioesterase DpgC